MIDTNAVLDVIVNANSLSLQERERLRPHCSVACNQLSQRLKSEEYATVSAVIMACASIAQYRYLLTTESDDDFLSFKAGDITVRQNREARIENAAKFKTESLVSATPYLTDIDFVFEAVEV